MPPDGGAARLSRDDDPTPLYQQFRLHLRRRIEGGEFPPGAQLPAESELAEQYGLSRGTVREGLDLLVRDAIVERRHGHGTFVRDPRISSEWNAYYGFVPALRAAGHRVVPRPISVETVRPDTKTAQLLRLNKEDEVVEVTRVIDVDDQPFLLNVNRIVADVCPGLAQVDLSREWLHDILENRYGVRIVHQERWLEPVMPTLHEQLLLEITSGVPCLQIDEINWSDQNRPVQFSKIVVRGDRCRPYVRLNWGPGPTRPDASEEGG